MHPSATPAATARSPAPGRARTLRAGCQPPGCGTSRSASKHASLHRSCPGDVSYAGNVHHPMRSCAMTLRIRRNRAWCGTLPSLRECDTMAASLRSPSAGPVTFPAVRSLICRKRLSLGAGHAIPTDGSRAERRIRACAPETDRAAPPLRRRCESVASCSCGSVVCGRSQRDGDFARAGTPPQPIAAVASSGRMPRGEHAPARRTARTLNPNSRTDES